MKLATWQAEGLVVALLLIVTVVLSGGSLREWLGALAVQLTFHHAAIADRMAEREAGKIVPDITCWRWSQRLFLGKELCWLVYFLWSQTFTALTGVGVFLLYPAWRRFWRREHPLPRQA